MDATRRLALRRGVTLEVVTVTWMAIEAAVAIGAGVAARSVLLTAFGIDSLVELLSGIVLLRRLSTEARGLDETGVERLERSTTRISAVLLVALSGYVVLTSVAGLSFMVRPDVSIPGVVVAALALIAMPVLGAAKSNVNRTIRSMSLRADIAETTTCAFLAAVTLLGLAASMSLGWWWAQYVAALALLIWLVPETREAVEAARKGTAG